MSNLLSFTHRYTPLKRVTELPPPLPYDPIRCNTCGGVLNPNVQIDFMSKIWVCPFCMGRNQFPTHYAENISETNLPAELIPHFSTVEYELQNLPSTGPPAFIFVIDTSLDQEDLDELKDSLQQAVNLVPEESYVGVVSFGTMIQVHELGFSDMSRSYVFRGDKKYSSSR